MPKPVVTLSDDESEDAKTAKLFLDDLSMRGCITFVSAKVNSFAVRTNEDIIIKNLEDFEIFYDSFLEN